ncbi:MAG TPA: EAL domain-containing protein [Terriglobales bacterium]|nr:EAL domain-containing protein [Terriglobales bacterium]
MIHLRRNSLAQRIVAIVMTGTALALGTMMAAFLLLDNINSQSSLISHLTTLADVLGQNSAAALDFSDRRAAAEILNALRAEPPVVRGCLYDQSGALFAEYQRDAPGPPCPEGLTHIADPNRPTVVRPVMRHDERLGDLLLQSDLRELRERWRHLLEIAVLILFIAHLVGGFSGLILQRSVSKPIRDLAAAMHAVTVESCFDARVVVSGSAEIEQLAMGFNAMVEELEQRESARRKAEAQLQYQAMNDVLTGLPNRRLFADRLTKILALAEREKRSAGLLYVDLDGFKLVNDSLGHSTGDALLVQVAERLRLRVREADTLARLGGDEFTVILANIRATEEAALVARSLLEILSTPFTVEGHQLTISASIGISLFPDCATTAADLMQQADSAMYAAKRNGRNRVMYFTPELGSFVRERLNLENQLRAAMARGEIDVHYQPEFEVTSRRLVRFEALARWTHPTLGSIPPSKFIPVAEESGLIVGLGAYVLERACAEARTWQDHVGYPLQVAVNVSSIQFAREHFVEEVTEILRHTGLQPNLLQLELTESVMLTGAHRAAETMKKLKALGVGLAIDDFGTGYSCLSYLPTLPFDAMKIDRSFLKDLRANTGNGAMVHSLVTLAHNIGMRVIVEGVETPEQMHLIREFGGNEAQGYLLGKPTPDPMSVLAKQLTSGEQGDVADSANATR